MQLQINEQQPQPAISRISVFIKCYNTN